MLKCAWFVCCFTNIKTHLNVRVNLFFAAQHWMKEKENVKC